VADFTIGKPVQNMDDDFTIGEPLKLDMPGESIVTTPRQSTWDNLVSKFFTPKVSKAKAANIMGLSEQSGIRPSKVNRKYTEMVEPIMSRTYPTTKQAAESTMKIALVPAAIINPLGTAIGVGGFMGLDELKNAIVGWVKKEDYEFQGGKGISDLVDAEGFSRDAIDLMEFATEAYFAGKVSGLTKSLANAVRRTPTPEKKIALINEVAKEVKETGKSVDEVVRTKASVEETASAIDSDAVLEGGPTNDPSMPVKTPSLESMEASVKGGAVRNQDAKFAKKSSINLDRLDTTEDVKTFIDMRTQQLAEKIDKKTISWDETRAKAEEMGLDWQDIVKSGRKTKDLAAYVEATREFQVTQAQAVFDKIRKLPADKSKITDEMRIEILNDVANHGEVLAASSKMTAEIGRALNVHKKMMASDPEFVQTVGINKIMKEIIKKGNLEKDFDSIVADMKKVDITNLAEVNKIMQKYHKAGIMDMIYEGWLNMILSAPKTHIVNVAGSLIASGIKTIGEIPIAASLELLRGGKRKVFFGESKAEAFGAIHGIKDAGRAFLKAWQTEQPTGPWSKAEIPFIKAIPSKEVTIGGKTFELGGKQVRIPTKLLLATDEFFKTMIYRGSLSRQAYNMAHTEGVRGTNALNRIAELLQNPTEAMLDKAHGEANYMTYNNPLGTIGQHIMKIRDAIPGRLGYFFVPFIRTVTNLTKYSAERTPFNFAKIAYDYSKGKISKDELSNEIAKPIVGSILTLITATMVSEGMITGGGPKDKNKREALMQTGWRPYSFLIGDKYIGYNRYDPLGQIIGTSADITEIILNKPFPEEQDAKKLVGRMAFSLAKNWTSKTYLQGVSGILDAISDPVRYGDNFVNNFAGSLIPSVVASVARSSDPYFRQTDSILETLKSRIPTQSEKLLPKRDVWGNPVERKGGFTIQMLSPSDVSTDNPDFINKELVRLGVAPSMPSKKIRDVELTPIEYDVYTEFAGKEARRGVERYIESDAYATRRDEINKLAIENIIARKRQAIANQVWAAMEKTRRDAPRNKKYGRVTE